MRKIIGLIIFSMAIPGFGLELYIQDFSTGSWPAGYTFEGNWQIGTNWDGNDTPPAAIYNWTPGVAIWAFRKRMFTPLKNYWRNRKFNPN